MRFLSFIAIFMGLAASAGSAADTPPPDLAKAVAAWGSGSEYLVLDRDRRQELRYPGTDDVTDTVSVRLLSQGKVIGVKLVRSSEGGKAMSPAQIAAAQTNAQKQLPQSELSYVVPAFPSALGDFTYGLPSRRGNTLAVPFASIKRDDRHADGTVYIDTVTNRILKIDYVPNAFPKPASEGSGTMTFGEVLPGVWELTREEMHFAGRQLFIKGTADIVITHSHYRKFASRDAAEKAL